MRRILRDLLGAASLVSAVEPLPTNVLPLQNGAESTNAAVGSTQSYRTESFKPPNLAVTKNGEATQPGYLFFGETGPAATAPAPLIMTDTNDLIWQGPNGSPANGAWDVRVQTYKGQNVLTYWTGFASLIGGGLGQVHILDNTYTPITTICPNLPIFYANGQRKPCPLDLHDPTITPQGTLVVTAYNATTANLRSVGGTKPGYIFDALFYEIDIASGDIVFSWSALDHQARIPLTDSKQPLNFEGDPSKPSDPWDYFHINTVTKVTGGYLVNSRHYWTIFFVSAKDGSVVWLLEGSNGGDFTLGPDIFFSWEHHTRSTPGDNGMYTITMFNNNNNRPAQGVNASTGLEIQLNTNTMQANLNRQLYDPLERIVSQAQGSYQDLGNDHVLLGYGSVPVIKEFDGLGNTIMTASFGQNGNNGVKGYRSYRFPWTATPYYPPKVVARIKKRTTDVYMSWNGATDVDSWNIYTGDTIAKLKILKNVARTSFETHAQFTNKRMYLQVGAVRNGVEVRRSGAIQPVGA